MVTEDEISLMVPPVDRGADVVLYVKVPLEVDVIVVLEPPIGPTDVTVELGSIVIVELSVTVEVIVAPQSSSPYPQGTQVVFEVGDEEGAEPVADHPLVGQVSGVVVLG